MPHRHPNTIPSTSQPNPFLSHAPNSRIRCSIHNSPRLYSPATNATATNMFQAILDGNVGARAGRNARSHQGNASATLAWFFLTRWIGAAEARMGLPAAPVVLQRTGKKRGRVATPATESEA